jgi:hypothetical protein
MVCMLCLKMHAFPDTLLRTEAHAFLDACVNLISTRSNCFASLPTERTSAAREMATAMRVVGKKEGEGSKAMAMATRMAGEWTVMATKRVIVTTTRVAGERWRW